MEIITKEIPVEELISNFKENWIDSKKYILISTKEMMNQIKKNLENFCPKIKTSTITCLIEKVPNEFIHPLIIIELDQKFVKKEELEQFIEIHKEIFPIIPLNNQDDYNNVDDVGWFLRKIFGNENNNKNLNVIDQENDFFTDGDNLGISKVHFNFTMRKCASVFLQKGIELHSQGKYDQSIKSFEIANTLDKTFFTLYQLSIYYFQLKNYFRSFEYLQESLKLNDKFSQARFLLGVCFFKQGEFEKAINELEKIDYKTVRRRDVLDIELQLGKMNMMIGNDKESKIHFDRAEEITPEEFRATIINQILFFKLSFYRQINDYEQICNVLTILIKRMPKKQQYLILLGDIKFHLKKYDESEKYFLESLNLGEENNHMIFVQLAFLYLQQKKYSKALNQLEKCIPLKNKFSSELYSGIVDKIKCIQILLVKEKNNEKNMIESTLEELLKQIEFKDINPQSIQDNCKNVIDDSTKQSENSPVNLQEIPPISNDLLRDTELTCLQVVREFIRKKYSGNINLLKDDTDLFSNGINKKYPYDNYVYKNMIKNSENRNKTIIEQKPIDDLFDCLDFADFPFIIRKKMEIWEIPKEVVPRLTLISSARNTIAHHAGSDGHGNLDPTDANSHYYDCKVIIRCLKNEMDK